MNITQNLAKRYLELTLNNKHKWKIWEFSCKYYLIELKNPKSIIKKENKKTHDDLEYISAKW